MEKEKEEQIKNDEMQKAYLFIDVIREYGTNINRELIDGFLPVFKSDNALALETIMDSLSDFYVAKLFPKKEKFNYDFGYNCKEVSSAVKAYSDLSTCKDVFNTAVEKFKRRNNGTLEKYFEYLICITDFSNFLRFFQNLSKANTQNQKLIDYCQENYKCNLNDQKYKGIFKKAIDYRNSYSHESYEGAENFISSKKKEEALDAYKKVADIFFKNSGNLNRIYNNGKIVIASKPITFEYIFEKYSQYLLDDNKLFDVFGGNCNQKQRKIYGLTLSELDKKISMLAIPSTSKTAIEYENTKVLTKDVVQKITNINTTVLQSLFKYEDRVTKKQIMEIANNIPVFIDGKVFQGANNIIGDNKDNQILLSSEVLKPLEEIKKYAIVNFSSRIELNVETNNGETDSIKALAKDARDKISYFVSRGSIKYGQNLGQVYSRGIYETLRFAQQNKNQRLFVIVNNTKDADLLDDETSNCLVARFVGYGSAKKLIFTYKTETKLKNIANYTYFTSEEEKDESIITEKKPKPVIEVKVEPTKIVKTTEKEIPVTQNEVSKKEKTTEKRKAIPLPALGTVECKPENSEPLPLTIEIDEGTKLIDQNDKQIILGKLIGEGGEGTVYSIDSNRVAKVYNSKHLTQNRKEKLELLISSGLKIKKVCLPTSLLFDEKKEFVGYIMPKVSEKYLTFGESILQIGNSNSRKRIKNLNNWDRGSLAGLCYRLSNTFKSIHDYNLLIGDINANNILINLEDNQGSDFMIVDSDSFQVGPYPSPVGTPVFTSPEIYKRENTANPRYGNFLRTLEDEEYAIASLFFQILMLGQVPFAGKGVEGEGINALKQYNFDFRGQNSTGADTPDGPYRMIWTNTPKTIKDAFENVFTGKGIVKCNDWMKYFSSYAANIKNGNCTSELTPYRYPDSKIMQNFECEICKRQANLPKARYEKYVAYGDILRCAECDFKKIPIMKEKTKKTVCKMCGKQYDETLYKMARNRKLPDRIKLICPRCEELIAVKCYRCGKTYNEKRYKADKYGRRVMCKECNEKARNR